MEVIERLKKIEIFKYFHNNEEVLRKIADIIRIRKYETGKYIIKEGDIGNSMFILNKGAVKIERMTLSNDKFAILNLNEENNALFGEFAMMDNDLRSASIITLKKTECFEITKEDFDNLCNNDNKIGYYIIREIAKIMSEQLRKTTNDKFQLLQALINEDIS